MSQTLILLFHPDPSHSRANAALAKAASVLPDTQVVDMHALYPGGQVDMFRDGPAEVARLLAADRIVLLFPVMWYSTPPLLKAWQDAVLTRMFYVHPETEGRGLEGKSLMVATTAGNVLEAYRPGGRNLFTMEALMAPLMATANRCGLTWTAPFVVYQADKLTDEALAAAAGEFQQALQDWASQPVRQLLAAGA